MFYTVYQITNKINGRIYIGVHKTNDLNDGYMGSGRTLRTHQKKFGLEYFEKEILFIFDNPEEMYAKEKELVNEEFVARKDTYNLKTGGHGGWGHCKGMVTVRDMDGNCFNVSIDDPRYLSGELKSITVGRVIVRGHDGTNIMVSKDDIRYVSGELKPALTGVVCTDDHKNKVSMSLLRHYETHDGVWTGRHHSESTKKKIREAKIGHGIGENNSQYGKRWLYSYDEKICVKLGCDKIDEYIARGYKFGRVFNFDKITADGEYILGECHCGERITSINPNSSKKYCSEKCSRNK